MLKKEIGNKSSFGTYYYLNMNIHNDETFEQSASDMIIINQMERRCITDHNHTSLFLEIAWKHVGNLSSILNFASLLNQLSSKWIYILQLKHWLAWLIAEGWKNRR